MTLETTTGADFTGVRNMPYWLDPRAGAADAERPTTHRLAEDITADLAVIGGGYTGLWTALLAAETGEYERIVVLDADEFGAAASGRNGGFLASSLTHGLANGHERYPAEIARLEQLGLQNLDEIEQTVTRYGIDCDLDRRGQLRVATAGWQVDELETAVDLGRRYGLRRELLNEREVRELVDSPTYLGGMISANDYATVHPARLAWGIANAAAGHGVELYSRSPAVQVSRTDGGVLVRTPSGSVRAGRVAWATGAFRTPLKRTRYYVLPVYDYAIVTEPLDETEAKTIWREQMPIADSGNQFHYYRLLPDRRVLFGGYDAVYHFGNRISEDLYRRTETFHRLGRHLVETFPQLAGVRVSHAWGGVIDTSTRFMALYGTAFAGRLAYATGYTGLGVGASRFGAKVLLDRLGGRDTEITRLEMVRKKPMPFPPEPIRYPVVQLTAKSLARADANEGRRNAWLRLLDWFGVGFDT
jgi:glycine/D-amino acid oxidase-like deaminating enzyme